MEKLLTQLVENLSFVMMCLGIILLLIGLAKLSERKLALHKVSPARRVSIIGICAAIAASKSPIPSWRSRTRTFSSRTSTSAIRS